MKPEMRTLLVAAKQYNNSIDYEFPQNMVFNNRGLVDEEQLRIIIDHAIYQAMM